MASFHGKAAGQEALPSGRAFFVAGVVLLTIVGGRLDAFAQASIKGCEMKEEEAMVLGEEFGIAVEFADQRPSAAAAALGAHIRAELPRL